MKTPYPGFIDKLPEADIPFEGVYARLLQGHEQQVAFFELPEGFAIPLHSHCAQWGLVVSGELELTISGDKRLYVAGDEYYIEDGEVHEALALTRVRALDFFNDPKRYKVK
jgi:quercetin dioxygenase-like cupin family protein